MNKKYSVKILFCVIIVLGFLLRIWNIDKNPAGFFADEASIGYNGYSILKTGRDEYGKFFPIVFESFGDYKPPLAVYATIPSILIFGLSEFSTRLPSVFMGVLTIVVAFFLGKEIKSKTFGLWNSFIIATIPWLIHYNRTGFDYTIYSFFFLATFYLFIKALNQKIYIIPAFIISGITLYTYQSAKLLIPLLVSGILLLNMKIFLRNKKRSIIGILLFMIIAFPLLISFVSGEGYARFKMVSIFSTGLSHSQIFSKMIGNYILQLSPFYLIGGEPTFITRHFVGGLTPVLIITMPFFIFGILHIFINLKKKISQHILYLLIIYPVAGALTANAPFTGRSIIGGLVYSLIVGIGIEAVLLFNKKYINYFIFSATLISAILINLIFFMRFYFVNYRLYSADYWGWQYGPRDIIKYFTLQKNKYDELFLSGMFNAPEIFLKFYDPDRSCTNCFVGGFEKFSYNKKQLFALRVSEITEILKKNPEIVFKTEKTIYLPNQKAEFFIGQFLENKINQN